jgi:hypothetical protein
MLGLATGENDDVLREALLDYTREPDLRSRGGILAEVIEPGSNRVRQGSGSSLAGAPGAAPK